MKGAATLLILITLGVSGCGSLTEQSAGARDHLVGWYKLGDTLIPVFKTHGTYYSVCRGFEAPFKECPEGLEWALTPSSMAGTKIGCEVASKAYYIIIEDKLLEHNYQHYISGEKKPMTKIDKPSWMLDATAQPPQTNDDFLGWYQPVWIPIRFEIRKEGKKYLIASQEPDESGVWKTQSEMQELTPIADRLGFVMSRRKDKCTSITYNESLKRFELTEQRSKRQPDVIRMPIARVSPHTERAAIPPPMRIGIPSWH